MNQSEAESVKDLAKEKQMTTEQTLVKVFTEVFRSLGELQRVANEIEAHLEEKDEKR